MTKDLTLRRFAKSADIDPYDLAFALIDRGVDVNDVDVVLPKAARLAARAVLRELRGGPSIVRPVPGRGASFAIEPARRSPDLVGILSLDDVLFIHQRLCEDFAATADPIEPPGVRSLPLLASAVGRQEIGHGESLKYHEPVVNAATLLYGICNDHPFHNGNKRTALVAALAHLDRNRYLLPQTKQQELFRLMMSVASHQVVQQSVKIGRDTQVVPRRGEPDEEVAAIAEWLRQRVTKIKRGETPITYRELRLILSNFGFELIGQHNEKVAICRGEARVGLFRKQPRALMSIDWPSDGRTVQIGVVKRIRKTLSLCEEDGVTSEAFYNRGVRVDRFINQYRVVLRKLASQ